MDITNLNELPMQPEKFSTTWLESVDWSKLPESASMTMEERAFVNGLIRYYNPTEVLELGVNRGVGTINILNSIIDKPESTLVSIDIAEHVTKGVPVGEEVLRAFPGLPANKWKLIAGKDASEVMESLGKTFDFAVIDTAHYHPIESLNFLSILPFMKDGSIVVVHDTNLQILGDNGTAFAARLLFSVVAANKLEPDLPGRDLTDIAAIQITPDTRKYIGNVIDALFHPWEIYPSSIISSVRELLQKNYPQSFLEKFDTAASKNRVFVASGQRTYNESVMISEYNAIPSNTIFYGAGAAMRNILDRFDTAGVPFRHTIWDQSSSINEIAGFHVAIPDFETQTNEEIPVVITIKNKDIAAEVRAKLESLGYAVFHEFGSFLDSL
ncbi:MAG: class I SAM-dependent methyltransferase [Oscillospiraceae bacterium]|nr:class I SAM-dependent methyltransferase [Oscillospiraceae bacterium]